MTMGTSMGTAHSGGLSGPGAGSMVTCSTGGKNGNSDFGKDMLDYDHSYRKETKKLLGIKTCLIIATLLMLAIILL